MKNKIKFIYFDVGGIFFDWQNYFMNAAKKHNIDRKMIIKLFNQYDEQLTKGLITPQEFWGKCRKKLAIKDAEEYDFLKSWVDDYIPILEVHKFTKELWKKYRIGIISNIYHGMFLLLLKRNKVPDIPFDLSILSGDIGIQKPEIEIYKLAQNKARVKPHEILFVDDSKSSLEPARELGWQTLLFETHKSDKSIAGIRSLLG